ncbi:interleukin-17D isoform X2 [Anabas testudineus]|uniref:interleukin-17D isoform X2 n=1 Tax=Anabas testudineus TaxID=64144 RepID=UPI000E457EAF|nr:interleukin-17D isoform X2 [Anabas testudineus]
MCLHHLRVVFVKKELKGTESCSVKTFFHRVSSVFWHQTTRMMPRRIRVLLLLLHLTVLLLGWSSGANRVRKKATGTRSCLDLPEELLEQMFGRLSVGVMSAFHHALQLEPEDKLNLSCPTTARTTADRKTRLPINLLSISPWAYRMSYSPTRYPRYIPEAYCLCTGCLMGPHGEESPQYRSTPVYSPSVILRRTGSCVGGRHSYIERYVSIAVGCTCVPLLHKERNDQRSNQSLERNDQRSNQSLERNDQRSNQSLERNDQRSNQSLERNDQRSNQSLERNDQRSNQSLERNDQRSNQSLERNDQRSNQSLERVEPKGKRRVSSRKTV